MQSSIFNYARCETDAHTQNQKHIYTGMYTHRYTQTSHAYVISHWKQETISLFQGLGYVRVKKRTRHLLTGIIKPYNSKGIWLQNGRQTCTYIG